MQLQGILDQRFFTSFDFNHWINQLQRFEHNYSTRKELAQLPAYRLKDLGLTAEAVKNEVAKPFWR